ncbi:MAG: fumarylacetoacetate hydrolase family protein [Acidimicrobiia bacterium]
MKLARARVGTEIVPVLVTDEGLLDLSGHVGDIDRAFLSNGGVDLVRSLDTASLSTVESEDYASCIARPGMVMCIGQNFADHAEEAGQPVPDEPILFQKATNTVVGPNDPIIIPRNSQKTDWEVELGIVLGAKARYLDDEAAGWNAIAGYAVSHDVSERAFQLELGGQWTKGKSCESFNPVGPWLVTADEVADPMNLGMRTTVNGQLMQNGSTKTMIFNPGHLVWYISQFMVLEPGDLINAGTPPGVGFGKKPPQYLSAGDTVEVAIDGLGIQRQVCVDAS